MPKKTFIDIKLIQTTGLQMRAALDMDAVREYAEAERERKAVFPPLEVFRDKAGKYWLADGFHRLAAYRQNGKTKVCCDVTDGEFVDALRAALGANVTHGMRRTRADVQTAISTAYEQRKKLGLPDDVSARVIADLVGCNHETASGQLAKIASWANRTTTTGADNRTRTLPPPPPRRPAPPPADPDPEDGSGDMCDAPPSRPTPPVRPPVAPPAPSRKAAPPVLPNDERGKQVPPGLVEVWNRRGEVSALAKQVSKVRCDLRAAQEGNDPLFGEINFSSVLSHLDMAFKELTSAEPWCLCPSCQGIGCAMCKKLGMMSKFRFDNVVPGELKG